MCLNIIYKYDKKTRLNNATDTITIVVNIYNLYLIYIFIIKIDFT